MPDEPLMVTVTGPEGQSLQIPLRYVSDGDNIAADLLIYGSAFIRLDPEPYRESFGIGIPEMLQQQMEEWKGK